MIPQHATIPICDMSYSPTESADLSFYFITGIADVAPSSVLPGACAKTPPREQFYSLLTNKEQLRKIEECKMMMLKVEKTTKRRRSTAKKTEEKDWGEGLLEGQNN